MVADRPYSLPNYLGLTTQQAAPPSLELVDDGRIALGMSKLVIDAGLDRLVAIEQLDRALERGGSRLSRTSLVRPDDARARTSSSLERLEWAELGSAQTR